ncbi:hypothetical protein [Vagococcus sp.]|uniref:hypothetical protein n=1 Tax=Vagococcus sp. TaxID=1933889 RepID=UPI002FC8B41E
MKKKAVKLSALLLLLFPSLAFAENSITSVSEVQDSTSIQQSEAEKTSISSEKVISQSKEASKTVETTESSVTETEETAETDDILKEEVDNKYVTIVKADEKIWQEIDKEPSTTTEHLINQTFSVKEIATTKEGKVYFLLYSKENNVIGYVAKEGVEEAEGEQGIAQKNNEFVALKDQSVSIYSNFSWEIKKVAETIFEETLHAKEVYHHFNGKTYYSLFDNKNNWQGYVEDKDVKIGDGRQGPWLKLDKYVTISKKNYSIWANFSWTEKNNTTNLINKTVHAQGYYRHFNGSVYYSLFDGSGTWLGYVNKNAVTETEGRQGPWIKTTKYVTITNKNYPTYSNFNWQVRHQASSLINRTFKVTGRYEHLNGSTYYSLYDDNNKWFGYVNKNAVKEGTGRQGAFISSNDFVTVTKGNYSVWQNFNWKKKKSSSSLLNKTYQVKGYYHHMNGSIYYSLYDNKGNWQGYLNDGGAQKAPGKQGIWFRMNQQGTVVKSGYTLWSNFNWSKKGTTAGMVNKKYRVGGYYNHFNGDVYYSLYDNSGSWLGYLNSSAVKFKTTAADYLGTTRDRVLNHLKSHEYDSFYKGTPFRGLSYDPAYSMSPNGRPNGYGPGMNCTGFVAYAYREGGSNLNKITQVSNSWGGAANAYNWRNALTKNIDYETFSTIGQLIASGKAKKGDIIYLEADFSKPSPDPHIGVFWGDTGYQNRFFHCTWPTVKISEIYSYTPYSKVYLFPL